MPPGPTTDDRVVARVVLKRHQLPSMTPYPGPRSVLVMDNCLFHHNEEIKMVIQAAGVINANGAYDGGELNPREKQFVVGNIGNVEAERVAPLVASCWIG